MVQRGRSIRRLRRSHCALLLLPLSLALISCSGTIGKLREESHRAAAERAAKWRELRGGPQPPQPAAPSAPVRPRSRPAAPDTAPPPLPEKDEQPLQQLRDFVLTPASSRMG